MDIESDNESPPKKKQKLEPQNEFEKGFIPHTEINKIVSFTEDYYKSNLSLYLHNYFMTQTIVEYLKKQNIQNVYHELFASDWDAYIYFGKYYVQWLSGNSDDYTEVPLKIQLDKPWLNDETGEFMGYVSRKCQGWRCMTNSDKGILKWQVFFLDKYWWREDLWSDDVSHDLYEYEKLMCGTFESADEEEPVVCLYEVKWDWKTDGFVKTCLSRMDLYDINRDDKYEYKKYFVKICQDIRDELE